MGRKKSTVQKIENPTGRLVTYRKRKDMIAKKAAELSALCGTDVGLIMFSPDGELTSFASSGSVEDVFLRYLNLANVLRGGLVESQEVLRQGLRNGKCEAQMLEAMTKMEALEEELAVLNKQQAEAQEKIRSYNPEPGEIGSVQEAEVHIKFLHDAIRRIECLKQARLFGNQLLLPQESASFEVPAASVGASNWATTNSAYSILNRNHPDDERRREVGPHLPDGEHRGEAVLHQSIDDDRQGKAGSHLSIASSTPQAEWNI